MAFKRALILGGALLLAAACSTSSTAPIAKVDGGASSARSALPIKPIQLIAPTAATADSLVCTKTYTVPAGAVDSVCVYEQQ